MLTIIFLISLRFLTSLIATCMARGSIVRHAQGSGPYADVRSAGACLAL